MGALYDFDPYDGYGEYVPAESPEGAVEEYAPAGDLEQLGALEDPNVLSEVMPVGWQAAHSAHLPVGLAIFWDAGYDYDYVSGTEPDA